VKSAAAAVSYEQRDRATRKEEAGRVNKAREVVKGVKRDDAQSVTVKRETARTLSPHMFKCFV
jgi:Cu/Ag efflux protein CusF